MNQTTAQKTWPPVSELPSLSALIAQMTAESRALASGSMTTLPVPQPRPMPQALWTQPVPDAQARALEDAMTALTEANQLLSQQQSRIAQLEGMLMQDEMTGLLNRRGLEAQFVKEQSRIRRKQSRGCTLVIFDLDKFKNINDTFGHPAGDAALRVVGDFFLRTIRTTDAIARIGGDEFALLLTDIYPDVANRRAAAISLELNNLSFRWSGGAHISISSSIGVARCMADETLDSLYRQADVALYATKHRLRS